MSQGGKAQPVYVVTDAELLENGGTFRIKSGPAVRVTGLTSATLETTDRGVTGGDSFTPSAAGWARVRIYSYATAGTVYFDSLAVA